MWPYIFVQVFQTIFNDDFILLLWITGPNTYSLPFMIGKTVQSSKRQAPCYSLTSRSKIGSFSEDLTKVIAAANNCFTNASFIWLIFQLTGSSARGSSSLHLKVPPILCSRRQLQILPLFKKNQIRHDNLKKYHTLFFFENSERCCHLLQSWLAL